MSVVPTMRTNRSRDLKRMLKRSPSVQEVGNQTHPLHPDLDAAPSKADAAAAPRRLSVKRCERKSSSASPVLPTRQPGLTKQATASAVAASKVGIAKAAKIGRRRSCRAGAPAPRCANARVPDRLRKDYRDFLLWLHANVLDQRDRAPVLRSHQGACAARQALTLRGNNRASGHDYKPTPNFVFKWALAAVAEEDIGRMSFVDYGAGKGRVMLLASQYPFTQVGGIEFAEELHDNATMNIAQFPRSQHEMPQRRVRARRRGQHHDARRRGGALFLQPVRARDLHRGAEGDRRLVSRAARAASM